MSVTKDLFTVTTNSAVALFLAVLAVLAFTFASGSPASASAATPGPNVFAGQWATTATAPGVSPTSGSVTFKVVSDAAGANDVQKLGGQACAEPTTYYYGNYSAGFLTNGVIAGCTAAAGHLVGRFAVGSSTTDTGPGDLTFAAPNTFAGQVTYHGSQISLTGTFSAHTADDGCCPGSTPPPTGPPTTNPPPTTPPPTGKPPAGPPPPSGPSPTPSGPGGPASSMQGGPSSPTPTPVTGYHLATQTATNALPGSGLVVVAEPVPGASVTIASPNPLTGNASTASFKVTDSLGDLPGSTIVAPGELATHASGEQIACWLIGPDAVRPPSSVYGRSIDPRFFAGRLGASQAYTTCAAVARSFAAAGATHPTAAPAQARGGGCAARRIEVAVRAKAGLITDARPLAGAGPAPSGVRYTCERGVDGSLKITITAAHQGGLRTALGAQLRLGVVRAPAASARHATLTFSFGASWSGSWHTTHGAMRLTQHGVHLTGTYAVCRGRATVTGTVTGASFDGTWSQPCDSRGGRLHFKLAPNGQAFTGNWSYGRVAPTMTWNAIRAASPGR